MFLRISTIVCFLSFISCVQQVKVEADNRVKSSRVFLSCNESQTMTERTSYCAAKSTRCILRGITVAAKDEITHPKQAHYIACLLFDKSVVTIIPRDFFSTYPVIQFINLSYSKVFKINDGTFGLPSLIEINLRGNHLISLSADVFDGASSLQRVDFSQNKIKFIEPATFMNLRSLGELDLSFNEIHNNTFNRNGADWIDMMESLKVLDLSHNNIFYHDFMPYHTFSGLVNLESLNLRSNRITIDYGNFATNRQLKTLDLSYNKMTYFDLNFLLSVASLESLLLHGNNIAYASQVDLSDIRTTFPEIKTLGLSENEFTCEMLSATIKKMMKANIRLLVDEEKFVSDRRNLRGVSCI